MSIIQEKNLYALGLCKDFRKHKKHDPFTEKNEKLDFEVKTS